MTRKDVNRATILNMSVQANGFDELSVIAKKVFEAMDSVQRSFRILNYKILNLHILPSLDCLFLDRSVEVEG